MNPATPNRPNRKRKWIILGAVVALFCGGLLLAWTIENRGHARLEAQLALMRGHPRPERFDQIFSQATYADNAAYPWQESHNIQPESKFAFNRIRKPDDILLLSDEDKAAVRQHIIESSGVLELLHEAANRPQLSMFSSPSQPVDDWKFMKLSGITMQVKILCVYRCLLAHESGETSVAIDSILLGAGLADKLSDLPMSISIALATLVHSSILPLAEKVLPGATLDEATLLKLIERLDADAYRKGKYLSLEHERLIMRAYSKTDEGRFAMMEIYTPGGLTGWRTWPGVRHFSQNFFIHHALYDLTRAQRLLGIQADIEREPYYKSLALRKKQDAEIASIKSERMWAVTVRNASRPRTPQEIRDLSRVELIRAALQCKRYYLAHGSYPASLSDLVPTYPNTQPLDSLTGTHFEYQRNEAGTTFTMSPGLPKPPNKSASKSATSRFVWREPETN